MLDGEADFLLCVTVSVAPDCHSSWSLFQPFFFLLLFNVAHYASALSRWPEQHKPENIFI